MKMNENLYRAKRKNWKNLSKGEWWVEGAYVVMHHNDKRTHLHHFIIPDGSDLSYGVKVEDILTEIDYDTLCRCTGKEYMDGEIAYEGDIYKNPRCGVVFVLKYGTYQAYCPADDAYMDSVGFYAEAEGYPQMPIGDLKEYGLKIGNIFDNSKLLADGK